MKKILGYGLAAFLAAGVAASSAQATNLVVDGGFESPAISTWYVNETSNFSGWTLVTNNVDIVHQGYNGASPAHEGAQYLDLVGYGSTGEISQSLATVAGQKYSLTFWYSNNPWSTSSASAVATVGSLTASVTHSGASAADLGWSKYTGSFVATGPTVLDFNNTYGYGNGGVLLDGISVSSVPETSTWIMMLAGFGALGFAGLRRKAVAAA
jgi:hypothetical protein